MPKVTQIQGERGRFFVQSDKKGNAPYLVDIFEDGGEGWCACPQHSMRVIPSRKKGKKSWCKHVRKVYAFFGWKMAKEISEAREIAKKARR